MADDLGVWEPYDVDTVATVMRTTDLVWWLSGGCALDRFVGRRTRTHGDIDISVRNDQLPRVAAQLEAHLELQIARDGKLSPLDSGSPDESVHGLWARAVGGGPWRLQINLEPCSGEEWIYRRDPRVHRPLGEVIQRREGLPCVNPAVQLLWKARSRAQGRDRPRQRVATAARERVLMARRRDRGRASRVAVARACRGRCLSYLHMLWFGSSAGAGSGRSPASVAPRTSSSSNSNGS